MTGKKKIPEHYTLKESLIERFYWKGREKTDAKKKKKAETQ